MKVSPRYGSIPSGVIFCAFFTFAAITCAGTYSGGSGTAEDPYKIATVADWQELIVASADWDKSFIVQNDIDFGGIALSPVAQDTQSTKDGFQGTPFSGSLDGDGHILSNLMVNGTNKDYYGLFGKLSKGQILNLSLENATITGRNYIGGLVGDNYAGTITTCYATGTVTSTNQHVGGLVGYNSGKVTDCHATSSVSGFDYIGGLVGENVSGTIVTCFATGDVSGTGTSSSMGGLVGDNNSIIMNCYATGSVTGSSSYAVGGLVGSNGGQITASFTTGSVSGSAKYIGGLVGVAWSGTITSCYSSGFVNYSSLSCVGGLVGYAHYDSTITACYSIGLVSGNPTSNVGGLIGCSDSRKITICFWDMQTAGQESSKGGRGLTTEQMKEQSVFQNAGWADKGWVIQDGEDYPRLGWENTEGTQIPPVVISFAGNGSEEDPYRISTAEEFAALSWYSGMCDKHFQLTENLDLSGIPLYPIGSLYGQYFTGLFDGKGHALSNGVIDQPGNEDVGLFGVVSSGGWIQNLGLENSNIIGFKNVGALTGRNMGTITDCYATGTVSSSEDYYGVVGGLVGSNSGSITDCYIAVNVSGAGNGIGGIVGLNYGRITTCLSTGTISGSGPYMGGLVGSNCGTITACYATGSINGSNEFVGGLVGLNDAGTITACYATGSVRSTKSYVGGLVGWNDKGTITACYATGSVSGSFNIGGLVGGNDDGTITACFWDMQTTGQAGSSGGKGLTTEQMKILSVYQNAGWADKGWVIQDGEDYPRLSWENTKGTPIPPAVIPFSGSGTADDPYLISTAEEFAALSWYSGIFDKHIRLTQDLDLSGIQLYPIGDLGFGFSGVIYGDGHMLSNVVIHQSDSSYVGLFAIVGSGGQIRNLGLEHTSIRGGYYVGGLVAYNSGEITACYVTGSISGTDYYTGGLVGRNEGGLITACYTTGIFDGSYFVGGFVGTNFQGSITDCCTIGSVSGSGEFVGGLVGENYDGPITACYTTATVSGLGNIVGGLVGGNSGPITTCYATDTINGSSYVGGLVGSNGGTITACYATGSANGSSYVGGLVGENNYTIETCYATGSVSGTGVIGGLVGQNSGTIMACYSTGAVIVTESTLDVRSAGGLVGVNNSMITTSYATSNVSGCGSDIGGLVGRNGGMIMACCAGGIVSGTGGTVGGLVGLNLRGWIMTSYATGPVKGSENVGGLVGKNDSGRITSCYANGSVIGSYDVGGLCGSKTIGGNNTDQGNFWDKETSGILTSTMGIGKTTAEMKTLLTFTGAGWDFVGETVKGTGDVWRMCGYGVSYPRLSWEFSRGGDLDCPDGVGMEDLAYLAGRWMAGTPAVVGAADGNGDGKVDLQDFGVLAENWMK